MGAGVLLTIGSLFYVIVLSITYFKKIKLNTLENRIFKMIIISNICGLLLHLILFCMMLFVGTNNIYTIIISKLYLVYLITYMALFTIYTFVISTKKRDYLEENFKKTIIGSALIILLISAFIFYLPIYFYNEPSKMYSYGEAVNLVYVFGFLMIGFNVLFLLKNIKQVLDKKYYPLLFYFSMGLLVSIIQFKYPYIQLITSMHAFIIFLMYLTIENPDIKLAKDLAFSKEIADRSRNKTLETLNNIEDKLEDSLNEMRKFGYKDVDYNDKEKVNHELKYIKNYCIHFVDDISGLIDVSKIDSGSIKIKEDEYETDSLFEDIKQILKYDSSKKLKVSIEIDDKIPESLYGDKNAIKQMILYIYDYLKDVVDKDNLSIKIDFIVVGNFCKLKFYFTTDKIAISKYIYNDDYVRLALFDVNDDNIKYMKIKKQEKLINSKIVIVNDNELLVTVMQKIIDPYVKMLENKENKGVKVEYFDVSDKRILILDNNNVDVKRIVLLLKPYKIDVDVSKTLDNMNDKLSSNKTYDMVLVDSGIDTQMEEYDVNLLRKFVGYKFKVIVMLSKGREKNKEKFLEHGFDDYMVKPIDKKSINDLMIKYIKD